jgi:hypothetical protein
MKTVLSLLLLATVAVIDGLPAQAQLSEPLSEVKSIPFGGRNVMAQATPLVSQAEEFVSLLARGEFNQALQKYHPMAQTTITPETLEITWQDLVAESGEFQEIVATETVQGDDQGAVLMTTRFEEDTVVLFIIFNEQQEIHSFTY